MRTTIRRFPIVQAPENHQTACEGAHFMTNKLADKVALVTGGSRGIGAAIAKRLALEGAAVAITYVNGKQHADAVIRDVETAAGKALAIQADSADAAALRSAVSSTVKSLGRLDILVNNAGLATMAAIDEFSLEDFDRMVAINVRAVFVACQEAARYMTAGGRIINIGSVNADRMPFPGGSVYAMTKAAVAGLTRGLARDLGSRGITVNNIQPGPIATDMNPPVGAFADSLRALMALPQYGDVSDVAGLVSYLASAEGRFITGASLNIDGGFTA
jgi:3-oxoacyl-[acyl-carrier protein] reductase